MSKNLIADSLLNEMKAYYEARAAEYDEWFYRQGRYDHGDEINNRWVSDTAEVKTALDNFAMSGDILELAPGTGIWTQQLIQKAQSITAIDSSPGMIKINCSKVADARVTYVLSDLFKWSPTTQFDGVFFGFWLSHVPQERLGKFLEKVSAALKPNGKLFFVDSLPDQTMSARNHTLPEIGSQSMKRILNDGQSFEIVKNFFEPDQLVQFCAAAGLEVEVLKTSHYFFYGRGKKL